MMGLPAISHQKLGPAMVKLNDRRRAFVLEYVALGRRNAGEAYVRAGYTASTKNSARVNACVLLHRDDIQDAIKEVCVGELIALGPTALQTASALMENPQIDASVRAKLALSFMDRVGMIARTEHKITVEHIGDDPQALAQIRELIKTAGMTPEQAEFLFGRTISGKVIDVEAQDITEEPGAVALAEEPGAAEPDREDGADPAANYAGLPEDLPAADPYDELV